MHHQTIVIGNIGRDPEVKVMPSGTSVAEFSVAANEKFKKSDGSKGEHTEWYNVRCYGRLAELVSEYRSKGDLVFIQGRLRTDTWEHEGKKHYKTYLNVDQMRGLSGFKETGKSAPAAAPAPTPEPAPAATEDFEDDIPF
jgi:single-strand DNA-binding protein